MTRMLVLRHAKKESVDPAREEYLEKQLPLDAEGEAAVRRLAAKLAGRVIRPNVYFTSCFAHAKQTGEILRDTIDEILRDTVDEIPDAQVVELCTLTPHFQGPRGLRGNWHGVHILKEIIREAELKVDNLRDLECVTLILHKPRVAQLLAAVTSQDISRFEHLAYLQGVCVNAVSLDALLQGTGEEDPGFSLIINAN